MDSGMMENENLSNRSLLFVLLSQLSVVAIALALAIKNRTRKRRPRRWWVRPINQRKSRQGDFYNLYREMRVEDHDYFFNYTRMSVPMFDELLHLLKPHLMKKSNRPSIPAECRLLITLRFLACGDCLQSIATSYRMGRSTVCVIIKETCNTIWKILQPIYISEISEDRWKSIAEDFKLRWNLPNCVGALDGKHVVIKQPNSSGSVYFNYKKSFSIILFGVCDAKYRFTVVDIGDYGSQSDGGVLKNSIFGLKLNSNGLNLPKDVPLPSTTDLFPHFFVGDDAFPLKENLLKPFSGKLLPEDQRIYNYRISRARRCIENTFGILVARWRIYHKTISAHPETVDSIVKATTCLHNFIMFKQESSSGKRYCNETYIDREVSNLIVEGNWRQEISNDEAALAPLQRRLGARNARQSALEYRNRLMQYVNNQGSVPWQRDYVNKY